MDKSMNRICFFSGDITRGGGTERVAIQIANALHLQGNYDVLILSLTEQDPEPFFPIEPEISRYSLGTKWLTPGPGYLQYLPKLRRFLKEQKVDVLIDVDIVLDILSLPVKKKSGVKVISWEHFNFDFENSVPYRRLILRYSAKRSDYCVVLTKEDETRYEQELHRTRAIQVIYNPMPIPDELPPFALRENLIITAGHLIPAKGIDYLIRVAARVLPSHPGWKWLVLGDGEEMLILQDAVEQYGLQESLLLPGRVSDVEAYLKRAKIFVLTSRREGLPMCILEARAYGLPCVAFAIAGIGELLTDNTTGFLIEPFDCEEMSRRLSELMDTPSLRECFSQNTLQNTECFSLAHILKEWNHILEQLCK